MNGSSEQKRGDHRVTTVLLVLVVGVMVGITTSLAKLAGQADIEPLAFLFWSVSGAAIVLTAQAALRSPRLTIKREILIYFVISALLSLVGPQLVLFAAIPKVGAAFASMAVAFPPLFTYLGALAFRMESFNTYRALGVACAMSGGAWIAVKKLSSDDASTMWIVAVLAAPVMLAAGNLYRTASWPGGREPGGLAPGMLAASAASLLFVGIATGSPLSMPISGKSLMLVAAQIANFSGYYFLFFVLQKIGGPVALSLIGAVGAVAGSTIAIFVLGEEPPDGLTLGAVGIAVGVVLVTRGIGKTRIEK